MTDAQTLRAAAAVDLSRLQVLHARGRDARDYLNRRLSQGILRIDCAAPCRGALLDSVGKVLADVEITAASDDHIRLLHHPREGYSLRADLERFLFSEDCAIAQGGALVGIFGPKAAEAAARFDGADAFPTAMLGEGLLLEGPDAAALLAQAASACEAVGGGAAPWEALDAARIRAGLPLYPQDFDESSTPLDAGLFNAVDQDKGCYPGQETIAKIVNLGHPAKALVVVEFPGGERPEPGAKAQRAGGGDGTATSTAPGAAIVRTAWANREPGAEWIVGGVAGRAVATARFE